MSGIKRFDSALFGKAVKQFRHQHVCNCPVCKGQISLRAAAKTVGISYTTLQRIEAGHPPTVEHFARVCSWMGTPADNWLNLSTHKGGTSDERKR